MTPEDVRIKYIDKMDDSKSNNKGSGDDTNEGSNLNNYGIDASKLNMTKTVENHYYDLTKKEKYNTITIGNETGHVTTQYKGESTRLYVQKGTTIIFGEIMEGGKPVPDKQLSNGLRWDVRGTINGKDGTWELVVDKDTNTVVHFLFNPKK